MASFWGSTRWQLLKLLLVVLPCKGFTEMAWPRTSNSPTKLVDSLPTGRVLDENSNRLVTTQQYVSRKEENPSPTLTKYHLIWSPCVWKLMVMSTLSLWIMQRTIDVNLHLIAPAQAQNVLLFNALLPTLSSACCWIQILLNAVTALGCAGFNTYLGPLRPFFLSLLTYLTVVTWKHTQPKVVALRWAIALLPELLHLWNTFKAAKRRMSRGTDTATDTITTPITDVVVYLDCPTMGCVACIQKVNSSLQKTLKSSSSNVHQIQAIDSWLSEGSRKGGKAKVWFLTIGGQEQVDPRVVKALVRTLKRAGFPCTVDVARARRRMK